MNIREGWWCCYL